MCTENITSISLLRKMTKEDKIENSIWLRKWKFTQLSKIVEFGAQEGLFPRYHIKIIKIMSLRIFKGFINCYQKTHKKSEYKLRTKNCPYLSEWHENIW